MRRAYGVLRPGMFAMTSPWWEPIARAAIIYIVLLVLVRLSGKRTVGQFTPFDLLVVMLLGESVSNALNGSDESVSYGLLGAATLILLAGLTGFVASRSRPVEELVQGSAVVIGQDGRPLTDELRRHRVSEAELEEALREADCDMQDMHLAVLEADGQISILKKKAPDGARKRGARR